MDYLDDLKLNDLNGKLLWPHLTERQREEERWRLGRLCGALYALQQWHRQRLSTTGLVDNSGTKRERLPT